MSKKQENIKQLLKLIEENPDLEIIPMVESEIVGSDDFPYWGGRWGEAKIDEVYYDECEGRISFKSSDMEEIIEDEYYEISDKYTDDAAMQMAEEIVNNYPWKKVIVVYIRTI